MNDNARCRKKEYDSADEFAKYKVYRDNIESGIVTLDISNSRAEEDVCI